VDALEVALTTAPVAVTLFMEWHPRWGGWCVEIEDANERVYGVAHADTKKLALRDAAYQAAMAMRS